jgi:hypothetical protein
MPAGTQRARGSKKLNTMDKVLDREWSDARMRDAMAKGSSKLAKEAAEELKRRERLRSKKMAKGGMVKKGKC